MSREDKAALARVLTDPHFVPELIGMMSVKTLKAIERTAKNDDAN